MPGGALDALGFDEKGAIYQVIDKAYCAMHDLHMKLHYESCGHGVGRAEEGQPRGTVPVDGGGKPPTSPDA